MLTIPALRSSYEAIYTDLSVLPRGASKRELTRYLRQRRPCCIGLVSPLLVYAPAEGILSGKERPRQDFTDRRGN